ncbi:hypothetical protein AEI23_04345 [Campylobacter jejuni]|uniref:Arylsulfotransferase n=1 Tax=Campylobacter jejuni TaxID=197 RepID=A0AAX2M2S7_CAMJU|nr:hypothetical protein AEI23_04345 [Campylobacter jejuni]KQH38055.1 hypothetical protein UC99_06040 [Campylobacter jejuni]KQH39831.1 hypothetical protein UC98_05480 [Campylobacter jejuni]KXU24951.1 hypothetical protein AOB51_07080 [Campylobacter jejuni]SUW93913.1 Arylsulfotransferase [Campylobacter jejuni]
MIKMNPYGLSPLTAIIMDNGYVLSDIKVTIVPKPNGQTISYNVNSKMAKTYMVEFLFLDFILLI